MMGGFEAPTYDKFSWGLFDRTASVRIPKQTVLKKKGHLEDRRPASNLNPYFVFTRLYKTLFE